MIVGVSIVKDEADIIEGTIRHLIGQGVDALIIADNVSTDDTRDILESSDLPLTVVDDPEVGYYQSAKMTGLAAQAGDAGAEWIVPFDADERWSGIGGTVAEVLHATSCDVVEAATYEYVGGWEWRRPDPKRFPKVAFRYQPGITVCQGNHAVTPSGQVERGRLRISEWQYRSLEQLTRKVRNGLRAYEATDLPATEGAHWRVLGALTDDELADRWEAMSQGPLVWDP